MEDFTNQFHDENLRKCMWPLVGSMAVGGALGMRSSNLVEKVKLLFTSGLESVIAKTDDSIMSALKKALITIHNLMSSHNFTKTWEITGNDSLTTKHLNNMANIKNDEYILRNVYEIHHAIKNVLANMRQTQTKRQKKIV
jgi:hypothetical protein